ncbi:hypothetical protein E5D57_012249 [Metarhizium anisopliae]|nr:hypothetical protein E5D57_012249 [Metarhizium anisopliae]
MYREQFASAPMSTVSMHFPKRNRMANSIITATADVSPNATLENWCGLMLTPASRLIARGQVRASCPADFCFYYFTKS